MKNLIILFKRDFWNLLINPVWFAFCVLFPFLLVSILGYMTRTNYSDSFTSYDYYGVTLMIYSALYTGTFAANSFMEERIKKANLRVLFAPLKTWYIPVSKILATFFYTSVLYSIVSFVLYVLFNINYGGTMFIYIWAMFIMINLASSSLGVFFCCLFKTEGIANQVLSLLTTILAVLGGLLFPIFNFGNTVVKIGEKSPLAPIVKNCFQLIYEHSINSYYVHIIGLVMFTIIMSVLSIILFKGEDYV